MKRRNFLTASAGAGLLSAQPDSAMPVSICPFFSSPVKIASSSSGSPEENISFAHGPLMARKALLTKDMEDFIPICCGA
jgi:hypothetical protein